MALLTCARAALGQPIADFWFLEWSLAGHWPPGRNIHHQHRPCLVSSEFVLILLVSVARHIHSSAIVDADSQSELATLHPSFIHKASTYILCVNFVLIVAKPHRNIVSSVPSTRGILLTTKVRMLRGCLYAIVVAGAAPLAPR